MFCLTLVSSTPASADPDDARTWYDAERGAVHIEWSADAAVTAYTVHRNGEVLAGLTADRTSFVDYRPLGAALYEVRAWTAGALAWSYEVLVVLVEEAADPDLPPAFQEPSPPVRYDLADPLPDCDLVAIQPLPPLAYMPTVYEHCLMSFIPPPPTERDGPVHGETSLGD